ncbi:MAG: heme exporter protein CcmB [Spirochaetes bacterium]|nr:heme exporter protein CcmB [Spirochaetota bacterium]
MKKRVFENLKKDYMVEFRNRYSIYVSISFAVISTLSISLASGGILIPQKIQAIILWIILFFSAMSGLPHIFTREEEQETALFLRLNAKPDVIFASKLLFNVTLFLILQIVIIPLYIFFLQLDIKSLSSFILTMFAGGLAMSASTAILAAITAKAKGKGPLFTVISFPVVLPVIWTSVDSTFIALSKTGCEGSNNIIFLFAYSVVITVISYLLFAHIWLEE